LPEIQGLKMTETGRNMFIISRIRQTRDKVNQQSTTTIPLLN